MALIDGRGRLLGRVNLIDALLVVFVVALIPIGVVASRVFRVHQPRIDDVVPAAQPAGNDRRIRLKGADFRPYLRLFLSPAGQPFSLQGHSVIQTEGVFRIESPTEVEVQLPPLPPGTYDIHLLDETREILARPSAVRLDPPPAVTLRATVRFVAPGDVAALLKVGDSDLGDGSAPGTSADRAVIAAISTATTPLAVIDSLPGRNGRLIAAASPGRAVEAQLTVPAVRNDLGIWTYRNQTVRPGDVFSFDTPSYSVRGVVTAVSPADETQDRRRDSQGGRP